MGKAPTLQARPDLVPAKGEVALVADWTARRDGYGKIIFTTWWWVDHIPGLGPGPHVRGQVFVSRPEDHHDSWTAQGYDVHVEQV